MDFDVRQAGPLDAILQRKAGIGKPCRIHHQPIEALVYSSIDASNGLAFNVAVENVEDIVMFPGVRLQHGVELGGRCSAVDRGLAPPEEGQVRALHEQDLRHLRSAHPEFPKTPGLCCESHPPQSMMAYIVLSRSRRFFIRQAAMCWLSIRDAAAPDA